MHDELCPAEISVEAASAPDDGGLLELSDEVVVFSSFEDADEDMRRRRWAMTPLERTQLLEELRRAAYPEEYRNPPAFLEPAVVIPCPWG